MQIITIAMRNKHNLYNYPFLTNDAHKLYRTKFLEMLKNHKVKLFVYCF